jgi:hypothetical protein
MSSQLPNGKQQFIDGNGLPLVGGSVFHYIPSTTTPKTTYQDEALTIANPNPIILDARGQAIIWGSGDYRQVLQDSLGNLIWDQVVSDASASISAQITAFIALLASSVGSSLIGFIQSGAGAVLRTMQSKMREASVSITDFGAVAGADCTAAIMAGHAALAARGGGTLYVPGATSPYIISSTLIFNAANITLRGDGPSSVLMAENNAALNTMLNSSANGFRLEDIVLDGNRNSNGIVAFPTSAWILAVGGNNFKAVNVEIRASSQIAVFCGTNTVTPDGITFENCWIHDNGGVTAATGIGVGIYTGGSIFPHVNDLRVINCRIENNYNTVTAPGDSTAVNINGTNISVIGCFVQNNYNVGGGQININSGPNTTGSGDEISVVIGNNIRLTGTFGGDLTCGVEIDGRKCIVSGNNIIGMTADGVRFESSAGDAVICDNVITCAQVGINLINFGGVGIYRTRINDNQILTAGVSGISMQTSTNGSCIAENNYIDPSCPLPFNGLSNFTVVRGNTYFVQAVTGGLVAGASPYTFPKLNYDVTYSMSAANGITSMNLDSVNLSLSPSTPIFVKANHQITVFWTTTAPVFSIAPQQ